MPASHLLILSGIQPTDLSLIGATLSLAYRGSLDLDHMLLGLLSGPSDVRQVRLRSRRPFVPAAQNQLNNLAGLGIGASQWTNYTWNEEYGENTSRLCVFIPRASTRPEQLRFSSIPCGLVMGNSICPCTNEGLAPSANCECGAFEQIADHIPRSYSVPHTSGTTWSTRSDGFG